VGDVINHLCGILIEHRVVLDDDDQGMGLLHDSDKWRTVNLRLVFRALKRLSRVFYVEHSKPLEVRSTAIEYQISSSI
jgi:hypothetical protein